MSGIGRSGMNNTYTPAAASGVAGEPLAAGAVREGRVHEDRSMELPQLVRTIRAHWLGALALTLAGALAALGWALLQPKVYTATSSGIIQATYKASGADDFGASNLGDQIARTRAATYVTAAKSRVVAERVVAELNLPVTPNDLLSKIEIANPRDSTVIIVSADAGSPEAARDLAAAWVKGVAAHIEQLQREATGSVAVRLFPTEAADLPSQPTSPRTQLIVLIGLAVGTMLGIAYAVTRSVFDQRIRSAVALSERFGIPVVGQLPLVKAFTDESRLLSTPADGHATIDQTVISEALRELRTNLQFMNIDNPPRVIVVSSPLPGDGKSTVAANLAVVVAASGRKVVLVDGDLRRPQVAETFGLVGGVGLTDVLVGRAELADVLQPWAENLHVLGSGPIPPNPSELLGSEKMKAMLNELSEDALVLVDATPLIPVTDAAVLATRADGVLIVAGAGQTTWDAMSKAVENVTLTQSTVLGAILNRVPLRGPDSPTYGYGYNYDYRTGYGTPQGKRTVAAQSVDKEQHAEPVAESAPATASVGRRALV